ncbi:MAG: glycosyltransferase [Algoriphagus sp.]|uniref:glycosyltransferase n=1 Tax=Algoriphagus sp. TaxID=1872435 RepID=UPI002614643E|nr:glycosyltransferase [Algoriphagus sp.]MDG1277527.1 glycosyltransferase [Algoriphagus sp.]
MKPKLLFISESSPFPPRDGKRQRSLALVLGALTAYEVDYLILGNSIEYEQTATQEIPGLSFLFLAQCRQSSLIKKLGLGFFPNQKNRKNLKDFLKEKSYSKVLCRYALAARDLPDGLKYIIDVDDDYQELMKTKIANKASWWKKFRYIQIYLANRFFYFQILRKASRLIWVKNQKNSFSGSLLPNLPFQVLLRWEKPISTPNKKDILFVGKLSYEPNANGIRWFLEEVWPSIYQTGSGIVLTLVSSVAPDPALAQLIQSSPGVNLLIGVEDLLPIYNSHTCCIVPVFSGGGSNIKLAEALVLGRKVVSTTFGARGFEPWVGAGLIYLAKDVVGWERAILSILESPWKQAEFESVRNHFSIEMWNQSLIKILDES